MKTIALLKPALCTLRLGASRAHMRACFTSLSCMQPALGNIAYFIVCGVLDCVAFSFKMSLSSYWTPVDSGMWRFRHCICTSVWTCVYTLRHMFGVLIRFLSKQEWGHVRSLIWSLSFPLCSLSWRCMLKHENRWRSLEQLWDCSALE